MGDENWQDHQEHSRAMTRVTICPDFIGQSKSHDHAWVQRGMGSEYLWPVVQSTGVSLERPRNYTLLSFPTVNPHQVPN